MDTNNVVLAGPVSDFTHRQVPTATGSFNSCSLMVDTHAGKLRIDLKGLQDAAVVAFRARIAENEAPWAFILGGQLASDWNKKTEAYIYKVTCTASQVDIAAKAESLSEDLPEKINQVFIRGKLDSVSEDGIRAVVICEYSYFSRKEDKQITSKNYVTTANDKPIDKSLVGNTVAVSGRVLARLGPSFHAHLRAESFYVLSTS